MPLPNRSNIDIAIRQASDNRGGDMLLGGATSHNPTAHDFNSIRTALLTNSEDYIGWRDDFFGDTLNGTYAPDLSTGATAAIVAAAGGKVRLSTSTTDENHATLALGLHWLVSSGPTFFEARVANATATTERSVEVGVSDALLETAGEAFSSHDATLVDVASDAAVFAINTEESVTAWKAISVAAGGSPQGTTTGVTPVAGTYDTLRLEITATGDVSFYVNGNYITTHASAVATTAVLTPWLTITTQTTGDRLVDLDYWMIAGARV